MSYTTNNELTIVEQIETTGRASLTFNVDGCYGGIGGSIRVEVMRDTYSEETTFNFTVNTNFNPNPETDIVTALDNFTKTMETVTKTVEYYKIEEQMLAEAYETFKGSVEAEHAAAKERAKNDTSMFYTAEKEIDNLIDTARSGYGSYEMKVRYRGEDINFSIYANKGRDGKVRFERYGYRTSKKAIVRELQDRGAEVVNIERV